MAFETLLVTREESFAVVTLNRPPANAISETLVRELNDAVSGFAEDDAVRAVIITGAGDRIFCAGADLGDGVPDPRARQPRVERGPDARRREGARAEDRDAPADRHAADHRSGGRRARGADRPGPRDRDARVHEGAAHRGRLGRHPGVL